MTNSWNIDVEEGTIEPGNQCRCPRLHLFINVAGMEGHVEVNPANGEIKGKFKKPLKELNPMEMNFDSKQKPKFEYIAGGDLPKEFMAIDPAILNKENIVTLQTPTIDNPFYKLWTAPMFDEQLYRVIAAAALAHKDQFRDDGVPYITHPFGVAMILATHGLRSYNHIAAAIMHDIIEDTHWVRDDVCQCAGADVAEIVELLSKDDIGETYAEYYQALREHSVARQIKIADRIHNLRSMIDAWDGDKASRYVSYTLRDYTPWGFTDKYLGAELKKAVKMAVDWYGMEIDLTEMERCR